jgi:hypothetical protein
MIVGGTIDETRGCIPIVMEQRAGKANLFVYEDNKLYCEVRERSPNDYVIDLNRKSTKKRIVNEEGGQRYAQANDPETAISNALKEADSLLKNMMGDRYSVWTQFQAGLVNGLPHLNHGSSLTYITPVIFEEYSDTIRDLRTDKCIVYFSHGRADKPVFDLDLNVPEIYRVLARKVATTRVSSDSYEDHQYLKMCMAFKLSEAIKNKVKDVRVGAVPSMMRMDANGSYLKQSLDIAA